MAKLSITAAWEQTAVFVKREGRLLFPLGFMLMALPIALLRLLTPIATPGTLPAPGPWLLLLPLALVGLLLGNLAVIDLALSPGKSVRDSLRDGLRRLPRALAAALLVGFAYLAALILLSIIVALLVPGGIEAAARPGGATNPAAVRANFLLVVLLLPVSLFIGVRMLVLLPVAAAEKVGPIGMIRRSWSLTGGHFWKLLAFVLLLEILLWVLALAVVSVGGILIILLAGEIRPGSFGAFLMILLLAALITAIAPVVATLIARIYVQLAAPARSG
ncbi:MAG TPA: glycerophosphoryl diester phosphodiesterase membrane domain-containing protein [Allosphingosinicella sp.]|nr:glycerophosphoryl diester phosphodiesterase membrane domain-containing protein [Allosphingosinicella sp.]